MTHFLSLAPIIICFVHPKSAQGQIILTLVWSSRFVQACAWVIFSLSSAIIPINTYLGVTAACIHHLEGGMPGWHSDMQFAADSFRIITSLLLWKSLISRPLAVTVALPVAELWLQEFPPLISLFFIFCWHIWQLLFLIFSPASSQQCRWRSNGRH